MQNPPNHPEKPSEPKASVRNHNPEPEKLEGVPEPTVYNYNEFTGEIERSKASENKIAKSAPKRAFEGYARYSTLGFQMLAAMLLGVFGGLQADKWLHTSPWLTVLCTLIGVALAMYLVIKETA